MPVSLKRPSWPMRPGKNGTLLMASVKEMTENAELLKISSAGMDVILFWGYETRKEKPRLCVRRGWF
jgi:hypothetical protein